MTVRAQLGEVAEFINGAAFKPEDWGDDGAPIVRIQNLTDPSKPFNRTKRVVSDKVRVRPGDLLVSWSATLGVFVWDKAEDGLVNQHIFRVLPDKGVVDKSYLRHMLRDALVQMAKHAHGATMLHVNRAEFLATSIPLPPLPEQRRIASILDQADALRAKRRRALALLEQLPDSLFLDMFGRDSLADFETTPLGELVDRGRPLTYGILMPGPHTPGGIPYVRVTDMRDGGIAEETIRSTTPEIANSYSRSVLRPGDLLMSIRGHVGRTAIVPASLAGANITQDTARIALKGIDARFVRAWLATFRVQNWMKQRTKGVAVRGINLGDVKLIPISNPSLADQEKFGELTDAAERSRSIQREQLAKLDELFASLQHRAFAGEL